MLITTIQRRRKFTTVFVLMGAPLCPFVQMLRPTRILVDPYISSTLDRACLVEIPLYHRELPSLRHSVTPVLEYVTIGILLLNKCGHGSWSLRVILGSRSNNRPCQSPTFPARRGRLVMLGQPRAVI